MGEVSEKNGEGIAERELFQELGLNYKRAKEIREKRLGTSDWFTKAEGKGRPKIMLTTEGEAKLRIYAQVKKDAPDLTSQVAPDFFRTKVHQQINNKKAGKCLILVDHGDRGVTKEECAIPPRLHSRLTKGTNIRVWFVRDANGALYFHEDITPT